MSTKVTYKVSRMPRNSAAPDAEATKSPRLPESLRAHEGGWSATVVVGAFAYFGWAKDHPINAYRFRARVDLRSQRWTAETQTIMAYISDEIGHEIEADEVPPLRFSASNGIRGEYEAEVAVQPLTEWVEKWCRANLDADAAVKDAYWDFALGHSDTLPVNPLTSYAERALRALAQWHTAARRGVERWERCA